MSRIFQVHVSLDSGMGRTAVLSDTPDSGLHVWDIPDIPGLWDRKDSVIECGMGVLSDSGICVGYCRIPGLWDRKENDVVKFGTLWES